MVREALVVIIKDNTICMRKQAKKVVSLHNYKISPQCAFRSLSLISCSTSYVQYLPFLCQYFTDTCMTEGPSLEEALFKYVYYDGVLNHSQMLSWDFSFDEMAWDTNWQMWKKIKKIWWL